MRLSVDEALERIAERTGINTKDIRQKNKQRRNQVTDIYGREHVASGDSGAPAVVYLSISPNFGFLERFQFKLHIQPLVSTVTGGTSDTEVQINNTSLSVSGSSITPNPHKHTSPSHSHNLVNGVSYTHTDADDFRISVNGVDVTEYLMAQYGSWIDGEGIYPSTEIEEDYDLLRVASVLTAEGRTEDADKLLSAGYKPVSISSSKPFQAMLVEYTRYSHTNR